VRKMFESKRVVEAVARRLTGLGLDERSAIVVAEHLIDAELSGLRSHGVSRLAGIITTLASGNRNGPGIFGQPAPSVLRYDAHGELGIVAVTKAVERAREVALEQHVCVMATIGYVGTTGVLGTYTRFLAEAGLVGLALCSSEYAVAPHGGARAVLGTNPIAAAFPADPVFSADLATAAWAYGDLKLAMDEKRQIATGIVQDIDGNPSTDPNDADNGSQLPMAGHKGYALGLAVELLCGPLLGGKAGRNAVSGSDGTLIIALRADSYRPQDTVEREARLLFDEVRNTRRAPGVQEIRVPGDRYPRGADREYVELDVELLTRFEVTIA
jgi:L-2-hydroxycarboxylate dehydrogenase (NAD+)